MAQWEDSPGVVELPSGRRVRGCGVRHRVATTTDPDFAVYLTARDPGPFEWPYEWLRWPDFRLPDDPDRALDVLRIAYSRAKDDRVEIACGAGIGRTGTALAVLAVFDGMPPDDAVQWVRNNYHPRAVETRQQRRWIATAVDR